MGKLAVEVGKMLRTDHGLGGSGNANAVTALTAWAEAVAIRVRDAVPKLSYEGYWVSSGHEPDPRARVKGPGIRRFIVQRTYLSGRPGHNFTAFSVLKDVACAVSGGLPAFRSASGRCDRKTVENEVMNAVCRHLDPSLGPGVVAALEASAAGADRTAAEAQVRKNLEASEALRKRAAMTRLAEEMRRYDFREEDVVEAFRTSEVRKVHES